MKFFPALLPIIVFIGVFILVECGAESAERDPVMNHIHCYGSVINMAHYDNEGNRKRRLSQAEKNDGIELVIHKVTEGINPDWNDRKYALIEGDAANIQIFWGAYHKAKAVNPVAGTGTYQNDPVEQARHFVRTVLQKRVKGNNKVLLVWDLELDGDSYMKLQYARLAIEEIYRLTHTYPGIYTPQSYSTEHISGAATQSVEPALHDPHNSPQIKNTLEHCWLWLSLLDPDTPPFYPDIPKSSPWAHCGWTMWQFTTNLYELKHSFGREPNPMHRHSVAGTDGEFNYITIPHGKPLQQWYDKTAWDYKLYGSL